jgi:hypothetical protein
MGTFHLRKRWELVPHNVPSALGEAVVLTTYVNATLYHDMITVCTVTGILHLVNQTPFEWFLKQQATIETATYGSEFVAAHIAVEQIIDVRITMRYLGVAVKGKTIMFGDNQSVITSSTELQLPINKRHNALSYLQVQEAIAAGIVDFQKLLGANNPANVLSKHWGFQQAWPLLIPILFWQGDTSKCYTKALSDTTQPDGECHGLVPCNMPIKNVRPLGVNTVDGSWSVYKDEVSRMEVNLVLFLSTTMYQALERTRRSQSCSDSGNGVGQPILIT